MLLVCWGAGQQRWQAHSSTSLWPRWFSLLKERTFTALAACSDTAPLRVHAQVNAEKLNVAVGSLTLECCILDQPDGPGSLFADMTPEAMEQVG